MRIYKGGSVEATRAFLKKIGPTALYSFAPTNTMQSIYVTGDNNYSHVAGLNTFSPRDFNETLPIQYNRFEQGSSIKTLTEAKVHFLFHGIDLSQVGNYLTEDVFLVGKQIKTATLPTTLAPTLPNALNQYRWNIGTPVFNWDQNGSPIDYSAVGDLLNYSLVINTGAYGVDVDDGNPYPEEIRADAENYYAVRFDIARTSKKNVWDDYLALDIESDLRFKIYNTPTTYRQDDLSDMTINIKAGHAITKLGKKPAWNIIGEGTNFIRKSNDGLDATYYTGVNA